MPTGIAIARQITTGDYDLVITSSTPVDAGGGKQQSRGQGPAHVFTLVADPFVVWRSASIVPIR